MKRLFATVMLAGMAASLCYAQSDTPQTAPAAGAMTAQAPNAASSGEIRGSFPTTLVKSIDTKKLKEGDVVICQTSAALHSRSGMLIASGSKVIGHVTKAQARSKGDSDSSLGIVFDKIQVSKDKEIPIKGVLQAVGPNLGSNGPETGSLSGSGQLMAGRGGSTEQAPATDAAVAGPGAGRHPIAGAGSKTILNNQSEGVLGVKNLEMGKDSVLTSPNKELKLDAGTQMMINAQIDVPVQ
jgi:hypothetical protein